MRVRKIFHIDLSLPYPDIQSGEFRAVSLDPLTGGDPVFCHVGGGYLLVGEC